MELNLKNKVVIVTGGSSGLGKAISLAYGAEGAKVAVNYLRNEAKGLDFGDDAAGVVAEITDAGGTAFAVPADMSCEADVLAMFDAVTGEFGPIDVLVNNAAVVANGPITAYSVEQWEYTFSVNVTGVFVACRELVRRLLDEKRTGKIVNIASQAAFLGSTTGHLPYDSSKGAMVSMTRALAREVAAEGINVNAIAPGMIMTEMVAKTWELRKDRYLARIPVKRIAQPAEIANIAVFLGSDAASYMTGTTVDATGGMMMR